jgi:hypothetical protein
VDEEGIAQSRQGAKEEETKVREPTLCVFAPLREILRCFPEVISGHALGHSRRTRRGLIPTAPNDSLDGSGRFWQSRVVRQGLMDPDPINQDRTSRAVTTPDTGRPVSMISRSFHLNPVIDAHPRW